MKNRYQLMSPEEIVAKLKKLIKKIEDHFQSCILNIEITHAQFRVIFPIVKDKKGYSIQELSELVGIDKGFVSRTITDLENKGITYRDKELDSKERNYKIILTEKGQKIVDDLEKNRPQFDEGLESITEEELLNFIEVLNKLTK